MKILKITKQSISEAVHILKHGGTVVYPTETAYALGCDKESVAAMRKIFKIKNRPKEKGLPVICSSKTQVQKFFKLPPLAWKLWLKYWPKPLSIVLVRKNKKEEIPVRISSNKVARHLARGLGRPITSTSANISGEPTMYDAKDIEKIFFHRKNQPDLILDTGRLKKKLPSTIIKIKDEKIEVLRQGDVSIEY